MTLGSSRLVQEEAKPEGARPPLLLPRVTWVPTDLSGVLQILRANWRVAVLCVIAGIVGMIGFMAVIGPSYTVSAKILVRLGPEVATSPLLTARDGAQGGAGIRRSEDTMSVVEILTNPRLIHAAVTSFGEGFFADSPPVTPVQHIKSFFKAGLELVRAAMREATVLVGLRPPTTKLDRLVLAIGTGLRIEPVRRTDVIEVSLGFPSPRGGEVILGRFIDLALADYVQAYRTPGAKEFFAAGVAAQHAELRRAEQKLLAARTQGNPIWATAEQRSLLLRSQSDLQLQYQHAVSAAAETEAEVAMAEAALGALQSEVELSSVRARNRAIDELRARLIQLRMDYAGQRVRYGDAGPEVVELNRQIDTLTAALAAEPEYRIAEVTSGVNLAYQTLARDLTSKRILREGQRARVERLAGETERLARDLEGIGIAAIEIGRLEQEVARLRRGVDLYEKGLDEARIAEAMETVQLSRLRIVMPPTAEIVPSSPSIRRGLLIGLAAGLVLSFVVIVFLEYRRKSKPPEDTVVATVSSAVTLPPDSKVNT